MRIQTPKFNKKTWLYQKRSPLINVTLFLAMVGGLIWLIGRGTEQLGYNWQWYQIPKYIFQFQDGKFQFGLLIEGLMVTFRITAWSLVLAMVLGLVTALLRLSDSFIARIVARGYLELIRNTPLLVQIFFLYFVLAPIFGFSRFFAAVLALSLFEGAYISEIFRAGIVSIHRGQWEAAYSLGFNGYHQYRYIILPQAIRRILPPLTSQAISLIKDSALVSTIAVYDLTMQGRAIIADTFLTFEIWFTIAAIYLIITVALSLVVNIMESRLKVAD
ncbi:MAG: amino acid ABC transporter permease [Deltaproteobacteria bacterium]|nr:amino acid ABC transporter permease [Deltaproteobacteria bacterium]